MLLPFLSEALQLLDLLDKYLLSFVSRNLCIYKGISCLRHPMTILILNTIFPKGN